MFQIFFQGDSGSINMIFDFRNNFSQMEQILSGADLQNFSLEHGDITLENTLKHFSIFLKKKIR